MGVFDRGTVGSTPKPAPATSTPTPIGNIRIPPTPAPIPETGPEWDKLVGPKRDAAAALIALFESYDLGSLAPKIIQMIQEGMSADTIAIELANTKEYRQRFVANESRKSRGLPVLSPAEYIATERSYRQVMQSAGLPIGFYDHTDDFTKFLELDISPTEIQGRVNAASEVINQAPPETLNYLKQWYNTGDLVAFALDATTALPIIERRIKSAEAGALAQRQNIGLSRGVAEEIGRRNLSLGQMQQGFGQAGLDAPNVEKLADIYNSDATGEDVVRDVFLEDATSREKVRRLASQERGAFSGSSGANRTSLTRETNV